MAKKNTNTNSTNSTAEPLANTESNGDTPTVPGARKPASTKKTAPKKPSAPKAKKPAYTHKDIALRAYFIAEKRQDLGLPGNSHTDWLEAESQLRTESRAKTRAGGS